MSSHATKQRVHTVRLVRTLHALHDACQSVGNTDNRVFSLPERLRVRCIQCGIELTPDELRWLLHYGVSERSTRPRLGRIQDGYCARRTCDTYFYELTLEGADAAEGECLAQVAEEIEGEAYSDDGTQQPACLLSNLWESCWNRDVLAVAAALAAIGLVLWWNFRTPSWAARPTGAKYQADASSFPNAPLP